MPDTAHPKHDELLARLRLLAVTHNLEEKRQFGGHSFYRNGNMVCCTGKNGMMARVGKDQEAKALARPHAQPFNMTGRRMGGMIDVDMAGLVTDKDLEDWVTLALAFIDTLPPKQTKANAS